MNKKLQGYLLGALAAASYGTNPLFTLPLYSDGMNVDSVLVLRYLLAVPMVGLVILLRHRRLLIDWRQLLHLIGLGVLFAVSSLTLFQSYNYMDAGIASSLLFVYPIMTALIMTTMFHERLTLTTVGCIVMASLGIWLLYRTSDGATLSLMGTWLVFLSALTYAVYLVWMSQSRLNRMSTEVVTFYCLLFGSVLFVARLLMQGEVTLPTTPLMWGDVMCLALFPTALSLVLTTVAIQRIGSTPTAILGALEPVTAVVIGALVFGEQLTLREGLGIVFIILAVSLVVAAKHKG
jgi:drug/metabolite transporter (DMT)-like permease